jgi:hypothetical protein
VAWKRNAGSRKRPFSLARANIVGASPGLSRSCNAHYEMICLVPLSAFPGACASSTQTEDEEIWRNASIWELGRSSQPRSGAIQCYRRVHGRTVCATPIRVVARALPLLRLRPRPAGQRTFPYVVHIAGLGICIKTDMFHYKCSIV